MILRKLILLTSAAYVVNAAQAHAGIESLIAAAIQGFLLSSTAIAATATGTIATIAANLIVAGAAVGASVLLGGSRPRGGAIRPSDAKSTFESGESSVMEGIGLVRVGGLKAFGNTDGSTRVRLVARLQGPIDAVEAFYLGGREVTVEANGDVSSPPWARPGGSWCNWKDKKGTGAETAWSALTSMFPTLWTSAHKVRGIAQSLLTFYNPGLSEPKYLSLYQNGVPESEERVRAALIYDPRSGLTAWTDNGILACVHVMRRDPAFTFGRFNWDLIAAQANKADAAFETKAGSVKRAAVSGIWAWESERAETMQQFLDSIGAEIRMDDDGLIWFELVDDVPDPEIRFEANSDMYDFAWSSGPEAVERPNICRVKFYSRERNFELADINLEGIGWARVQSEIDRYGPKYFDVELPYQPHAAIAQWLARRKFYKARSATGRAVLNMVGLAAWGRLYAEIEEPDTGDIEIVRMDAPRIDDDNGSVELPFTVWPDLSVWNPEIDEADPPDIVPELGYESGMESPDPPTSAIQITYPGGSKELRIAYSLPAEPFDTVEANYRTYTGGLPNPYQGMTEIGEIGAYDAGNFLGQTIDARVRVFNGDEGSYFSPEATLVVIEDNSPATVVALPGDEATPTYFYSPSIQVAALRSQRRDGLIWTNLSTVQVRPFQQVTFTMPPIEGVTYRVQALTSDGSANPT